MKNGDLTALGLAALVGVGIYVSRTPKPAPNGKKGKGEVDPTTDCDKIPPAQLAAVRQFLASSDEAIINDTLGVSRAQIAQGIHNLADSVGGAGCKEMAAALHARADKLASGGGGNNNNGEDVLPPGVAEARALIEGVLFQAQAEKDPVKRAILAGQLEQASSAFRALGQTQAADELQAAANKIKAGVPVKM